MRRDPTAIELGLQDLLLRLREAPWKFGFTSLMRRLAAVHAAQPRIGLASRPQQEPFRLGQTAALIFAPREIAEVVLPGDADAPVMPGAPALRVGNNAAVPVVRLYGLGLLGPNGPLPLHYTEMVRDRTENHNDSTLADFLDLFHHRYLTHMYRAWSQSQAAAGLDRADDETFSRYIAQLTGHDPLEIRASVLPAHARMAASTHLSREARNPDGLAQTLARFFAVPVRLEEFVMHWIRIDDEDQTHLGQPRTSSVMGVGAIAGEVVADRQNKFRLVLGPLQLDQYLRFTPQGKDLPLLVEWVRGFVGYEFVWEVELRVRADSAPPARLGDTEKLGWSTWLGGSKAAGFGVTSRAMRAAPSDGYAVGMVFEPEQYLRPGYGA
ncbi:type VI secretion system baseplate subunit TssG [Variovorax arabinosiphilus]|uniref:type VI secretion system baseplate subunit TssG n=1 Tax=Variovorax arabinosiphilus TaxID=3053498 RepID=UPI002578FD27|nr:MULTISPECIES: type VI secretion system baseplate subunit TssG [unclassified Variovorax]MDM0120855.1 type VI secretion system baseplate subunit TssG [Variovorax sp. J2L1-78]MDM0127233.1 type VI secretion system baseplate subunit TssG [Variovorax sp. J2L1-63]MDM0236235.1 type VI secretion system baseplate subunit TssG [Variovorax sp. J2R1-6]